MAVVLSFLLLLYPLYIMPPRPPLPHRPPHINHNASCSRRQPHVSFFLLAFRGPKPNIRSNHNFLVNSPLNHLVLQLPPLPQSSSPPPPPNKDPFTLPLPFLRSSPAPPPSSPTSRHSAASQKQKIQTPNKPNPDAPGEWGWGRSFGLFLVLEITRKHMENFPGKQKEKLQKNAENSRKTYFCRMYQNFYIIDKRKGKKKNGKDTRHTSCDNTSDTLYTTTIIYST